MALKIISTTKNISLNPFSHNIDHIKKIYAGINAVIVLTDEGRLLFSECGVSLDDLKGWSNIHHIAVSNCVPGAVIGITEDGRCLVSKNTFNNSANPSALREKVLSWRGIVQAAASDSFFALDIFGNVRVADFSAGDRYEEVTRWKNIAHITTGSQDSVFGITKEGKVLCAGANLTCGPLGDIREKLDKLENVVDICVIGAECERIFVAFADGSISDLDGNKLDAGHNGKLPVFSANFALSAFRTADDTLYVNEYFFNDHKALKKLENRVPLSFAVGHIDFGEPFIVMLCKKNSVFDIF